MPKHKPKNTYFHGSSLWFLCAKRPEKQAKTALFSHRKFYHIFLEKTRFFPQIVDKKIIFIAGPSSSGKTTFANRLLEELKGRYEPIIVSMDDFFVEREETPLDENGKPDYETIKAIDLDLFNNKFNELLSGKMVTMPLYNFKTGMKEKGKTIQLKQNGIVIVEGIHGLNPVFSEKIDKDIVFKIYVEPQSTIISSGSIRKARRIFQGTR